jgi:hypothetical protein
MAGDGRQTCEDEDFRRCSRRRQPAKLEETRGAVSRKVGRDTTLVTAAARFEYNARSKLDCGVH